MFLHLIHGSVADPGQYSTDPGPADVKKTDPDPADIKKTDPDPGEILHT